MSDMIRVKQSDGSYHITTQAAEDKKKSLGISNSGSNKGTYSYKDKDTGKSMSTSSKAVADARSAGNYSDGLGGSFAPGSLPTDYGDSIKRAVNSAMILGNTLAPDFADGTRLAYKDQYGYTHTTPNSDVARLAGVGDIFKYFGPVTNSGYVANDKGESMMNADPSSLGGSKYTPKPLISGVGGISAMLPTPTTTQSKAQVSAPQVNLPTPQAQGGYLDSYGGLGGYAAGQQARYRQALSSGNTDLANRLQADASRVGYGLELPQVSQPATAQAANTLNMPLYDLPAAPTYDVYQPREFNQNKDWQAPDVNSRGITWVPTNQAINQFSQGEQNRYNASLNDYNNQRQNWSDQNNAYWQQSQEQQRRTENQQTTQTAEKQQQLANLMGIIQLTGNVTSETSAAFKQLTGFDLPPGLTAEQAMNQAQFALSQQKAASSGSGGGGGGSSGSGSSSVKPPSTQGERQALATTTLFNAASNRYEQLKGKGYDYPLYYAVSSLISDPEWISAARESGANVSQVVADLIRTKTQMSPEDYFNTANGAKLQSLFDSL